MVVDLLPILNTEGARMEVRGDVDLGGLRLTDGGPEFASPVQVDAAMTCIGDTIEFEGTVSGCFRVLCARCAKELTQAFSFPFSEALSNKPGQAPDNDEDGVIAFAGTTVDITDIISSNILVNLSLKYLCSDDCKGLCPTCGADLNAGPCGCVTDELDPRLSVLKKWLDE